jgi:hypothetical protein
MKKCVASFQITYFNVDGKILILKKYQISCDNLNTELKLAVDLSHMSRLNAFNSTHKLDLTAEKRNGVVGCDEMGEQGNWNICISMIERNRNKRILPAFFEIIVCSFKRFYELDLNRSITGNLKKKLVVEHPVFHVVTSHHLSSYDILSPDGTLNP